MTHDPLEIEFLGTGTSTGVPALGCECDVCHSSDPRDVRLRTSAIVRYRGVNLLIDCGPDFRTQMLRASDSRLDALLLTHIHYDHVGGLDDLRPYCHQKDFPIYAKQDVIDALHARLPYCFAEHPYPGVPLLHITPIDTAPFEVQGVEVIPVPVHHYWLDIVGFRIGPLTYITDAKTIDDDVVDSLRGTRLLVVNALRKKTHLSHMCLDETLEVVHRVRPERALLVHMSCAMGFHDEVQRELPPRVELAYDGLIVNV